LLADEVVTALLEDTPGGIAGDGAVILPGDGTAVRELANPRGAHRGSEGRVRPRRNEYAADHFERAAVRRMLGLLAGWERLLSKGNGNGQDEECRKKEKRNALHSAAFPRRIDFG